MPNSVSNPDPDLPDFFKGLFELRSLQQSNFGVEDPHHPVHSALLRAFNQNTIQILAVFRVARLVAQTDDIASAKRAANAAMVRALPLLAEFEELKEWLFPAVKPATRQETDIAARGLSDWGFSFSEISDAVRDMQRRPPIRPYDLRKRAAWIVGFEFMLSGKSYGIAKRDLCKQGFAVTSEETLRAGIRQLKRLLRRCAPELVTQFENLHPDRAKKVNP